MWLLLLSIFLSPGLCNSPSTTPTITACPGSGFTASFDNGAVNVDVVVYGGVASITMSSDKAWFSVGLNKKQMMKKGDMWISSGPLISDLNDYHSPKKGAKNVELDSGEVDGVESLRDKTVENSGGIRKVTFSRDLVTEDPYDVDITGDVDDTQIILWAWGDQWKQYHNKRGTYVATYSLIAVECALATPVPVGAPVVIPTTVECCLDFDAVCLACSFGISMEDYCSSVPITPGCETLSLTLPPVPAEPVAQWFVSDDTRVSCTTVCVNVGRNCYPPSFNDAMNDAFDSTSTEDHVSQIFTDVGLTCNIITTGDQSVPGPAYHPETGTCVTRHPDTKSKKCGGKVKNYKRVCPCK